MSQTIALIAVLVAWTSTTFLLLQLWTTGARRALLAPALVVVAATFVVVGHGHEHGIDWLRSERLRSDAFAIAALTASLASFAAWIAHGPARSTLWAPGSVAVTGVAGTIAGTAAIALGRSSWYWEFVAVIASGAVLAIVSAATAWRHRSRPNVVVVFGTATILGVVASVGGALLLVAWRSIA